MTEHAASSKSLRGRPTVGQWVVLIVALGLAWLVPMVVDGYADWPATPWIIAALMILVLVGWLLKLRSLGESQREGSGDREHAPNVTSRDGTSETGSA